ncbi:Nudix hydrolase 20, chloroplastic [Bagarius yarrelli]|uniref:Nudix hydrolase 20, chloroplastic n=1 Tax=Bagarius yarrelli TaxID=175774 RepID=A0A556VCE8_BAGYA|nr:Nudix hydrolase 20, chloroplastic [Bagarius yarrelli]
MPRFCDAPLMHMERAATSIFGVKRYGVHVNGFSRDKDGNLSMWLSRSYTYEDDEGVFPECQFLFDLELPTDFKPQIGDGEVHEFYFYPIEQVKELVVSEEFKPNCAMVVLDFLIRHSVIEPDTGGLTQSLNACVCVCVCVCVE